MDLDALVDRYGLPPDAARRLGELLDALDREPDPQTSVPRADWVDVHLADSLVALEVPVVRAATRIADVGAGAGFPGLPLAIALPEAQVDLIESSARKAELIERLAGAATVGNGRAIGARAEDWAAAGGAGVYDVVCARALAPLPVVLEYAAPLLALGGSLVAWKGRRDADGEAAGAATAAQLGLEPVEMRPVEPYAGSRNRHLYLYRKSSPTPDGFPRRPGMAAKRPLA